MKRAHGCLFGVALMLVLVAPMFAAEGGGGIPPGTVITMQNWQQYRNFIPDGMIALFQGEYFFKFPPDIRIEIGPTSTWRVNAAYVQNTEKYAGQVKIVDLPDGEHTLSGYEAGRPFPNPSGPRKGWEILVDEWYRYVPYEICSTNGIPAYLVDRFGHMTTEEVKESYRRMGHIS